MSVFEDRQAVLCGERNPNAHAVCVFNHPHEGRPHNWESVIYIAQRLRWTATPCKWANPFPGNE